MQKETQWEESNGQYVLIDVEFGTTSMACSKRNFGVALLAPELDLSNANITVRRTRWTGWNSFSDAVVVFALRHASANGVPNDLIRCQHRAYLSAMQCAVSEKAQT